MLILPEQADDEADDCHDSEYKEENFCDSHRACGDSAKSKYGGNECDDEKNNRIMQHHSLLAGAKQVVGAFSKHLSLA